MMPVGIVRKTKNNDNKKYREHTEWMEGKKIGRPKQRWVFDPQQYDDFNAGLTPVGHWEKIQ